MAGNEDYTRVQVEKTGPLIERTYRDSGPFQWIREVERNAAEAGAENIEFGVEWQGVEESGVFRMMVTDDGCGMGDEELRAFFGTFGGGGKAIGDANENFGIGAKTSLMPWNQRGLIVISWQDGDANMIRIEKMPNGEYGLRREIVEDEDGNSTGLVDVYPPYFDEELQIDFAAIKPKLIKGNGTVMVLLGNKRGQDTYLGDPRDGGGTTSVAAYLETRLYDSIDNKMRPRVLTYEGPKDLKAWPSEEPKSLTSAKSPIRTRTVKGLEFWIKGGTRKGVDLQSGVLDLGTAKAHWFLQEKRGYAGGSYAPNPGGVCVQVAGEVFYLSEHYARMRGFGIGEKAVRERVWIVIEPEVYTQAAWKADHAHYGVFMKTDRTSLAWGGNYLAHDLRSDEMPWTTWGDAFADQMPAPIEDALVEAKNRRQVAVGDVTERIYQRVQQRIAARLNRIKRYAADPKGKRQIKLELPGVGKRKVTEHEGSEEREETTKPEQRRKVVRRPVRRQGTQPGVDKASEAKVRHGLPEYLWVGADEFDAPWALAEFNHNEGPNGTVRLNKTHPTVLEAVAYHQDGMARQDKATRDQVEVIVLDQFTMLALATIVNAEQFRGQILDEDLNEKFRSPEALTVALTGVLSIDAMVGPMLGTVGRKAA